MPRPLPKRQQAVYDAIVAYLREHGVAPSTADLAQQFGISRTTVHGHLRALQRKGYLGHSEGVARSWRPLRGQPVRVPVVGSVAAGSPILAAENIEGHITFDDARHGETLFALRVRGDSMIAAGILDGDLVVVRRQDGAEDGDLVVALVDDEEPTVKKLRRDGDQLRLVPMNPAYEPLVLDGRRVRLVGKVVGLRRNYEENPPGG